MQDPAGSLGRAMKHDATRAADGETAGAVHHRDVAQLASALALGARGRRFESGRPYWNHTTVRARGRAGRRQTMRTLVLNAQMIPTGEVHVTEAVTKLVTGKAYTVEAHPEVVFRSRGLVIPAPVSIAMLRYVRLPASYYGRAPLSNPNLFVRDGERCQYCLRTRRELAALGLVLTREHVVPRSRGGPDTWENVVAACQACNCRKGARTPAEAGMALHTVPWVPSLGRIHRLRMEIRRKILEERMERME